MSGNGVRWTVSRDSGTGLSSCAGVCVLFRCCFRPVWVSLAAFLPLFSWLCYVCCLSPVSLFCILVMFVLVVVLFAKVSCAFFLVSLFLQVVLFPSPYSPCV
jgi:hypothetical protein